MSEMRAQIVAQFVGLLLRQDIHATEACAQRERIYKEQGFFCRCAQTHIWNVNRGFLDCLTMLEKIQPLLDFLVGLLVKCTGKLLHGLFEGSI